MSSTLINDPHFAPNQLEERIKLMWFQLKTAQITHDTRYIKPFIAESVLAKHLVQDKDSSGRVTVPSRSAVLQLRLSDIAVADGREYITCFMKTKYRRFLLNPDNGAKTVLDKRDYVYNETWSLSRPAGTQTPADRQTYSVHCEGCGAPVVLYRDATCPFCKAFIKVPDFTWTVDNITVEAAV